MIKRLFDIIFSFLGLIMTAPLFGLVVLLIKFNSKGPVFYKNIRVGRYGKSFKIYKFRTMAADADKLGVWSTAGDDPRLTKIGKVLRKYQFDELPQLINVLKGEMSFVGPRPQVPWAVELYNEEEKKTILSVRPGMTDYASLKFINEGEILRGSKDPDEDYLKKIDPEKRKLNLEYARNNSIFMDFKIILATFKKIFKK